MIAVFVDVVDIFLQRSFNFFNAHPSSDDASIFFSLSLRTVLEPF